MNNNPNNQDLQDMFAKKITKVLDAGLEVDASIQSRLEFARKQALAKMAVKPQEIKKPHVMVQAIRWISQYVTPRAIATTSMAMALLGVVQISGEERTSSNDLNYISQYMSTADSFDIQ